MQNLHNYNLYDNEQAKKEEKLKRDIERQYYLLISAVISGIVIKDIRTYNKKFSFNKFPYINSHINDRLYNFSSNITSLINNSIKDNIKLSFKKNGISPDTKMITDTYKEVIAKQGGIKLSSKVWNYTEQYKKEIENVITLGILKNKPKHKIAQDLRKYLKNPEQVYNIATDKAGKHVLSKNTRHLHRGSGIYNSSLKNALRLATSEVNTAYRVTDNKLYQSRIEVTGQLIRLSNNHTCNGVPFYDMCDELVGVYPKEFIFPGWHPNCRCKSVPIYVEVKDVLPNNFIKWYLDNYLRFTNGYLPYFISFNIDYFKKIGLPLPS